MSFADIFLLDTDIGMTKIPSFDCTAACCPALITNFLRVKVKSLLLLKYFRSLDYMNFKGCNSNNSVTNSAYTKKINVDFYPSKVNLIHSKVHQTFPTTQLCLI